MQFDYMNMEKEKQLHVMMVPWIGYGHVLPFLELAKRLHSHGLKISFVSTPVNISRIKNQIPPLGIDLVELPMPSVESLPDGVQSTADVMGEETFALLVEAMDQWEKPFEALLRRLSPDFIIHDMTAYWAPPIAAKLGIPTIFVVITAAASGSFMVGQAAAPGLDNKKTVEDLTVSPPDFPSSLIRYPLFQARNSLHFYEKKEGHVGGAERWSMCMKGSWVIAFNTCVELEGPYLEFLQRTTRRAVLPVGILMPTLPPRPADDRCLAWLDRQTPRSVVFVSFGSECTPTSHELAALALGLEESEVPFLCVLFGGVAAELPQGFVTRISMHGRGVVVTEWAPQLHILGHPSTGAFLTHCGWNSVTEGLRFGVPLITLPMRFEQHLTAKLIAGELKLGMEIRRNEEDASFTKEDISKAIRAVMGEGEKEGRQIRSNVEGISTVLTNNDYEISRSNIKNFVSLLKKKCFNKQELQCC